MTTYRDGVKRKDWGGTTRRMHALLARCTVCLYTCDDGYKIIRVKCYIRNYGMASPRKEIMIYVYREKSCALYDYVGSLHSPITVT